MEDATSTTKSTIAYGDFDDETLLAAAFPGHVAENTAFDAMKTEACLAECPELVTEMRKALIAESSMIAGEDWQYAKQKRKEANDQVKATRKLLRKWLGERRKWTRKMAAYQLGKGAKKFGDWAQGGLRRRAGNLEATGRQRDADELAQYRSSSSAYGGEELEEIGDEFLIAAAFPEEIAASPKFDAMKTEAEFSDFPNEVAALRAALVEDSSLIRGVDWQTTEAERDAVNRKIRAARANLRDLLRERGRLTRAMAAYQVGKGAKKFGGWLQKGLRKSAGNKERDRMRADAAELREYRAQKAAGLKQTMASEPELEPDSVSDEEEEVPPPPPPPYDLPAGEAASAAYGSDDDDYGSDDEEDVDDMYGYATEDEIPHELVLAEAFPRHVVDHAEFDPMTTPAVLSYHPEEVEALRACVTQINAGLIGADTEGYQRLQSARKAEKKRLRDLNRRRRLTDALDAPQGEESVCRDVVNAGDPGGSRSPTGLRGRNLPLARRHALRPDLVG